MAASAPVLLPPLSKPEADPSALSALYEAESSAASDLHLCVFSAEGACVEAPSPASRRCPTPSPSPASRRSPTSPR